MIEEGVENLAKNKLAGKLDIHIKIPDDKHVEVTVDIAIPRKGKIAAKLESKYANEVTNWSDHIRLLKKIKKYSIQTKKEIKQSRGIIHHITRVTLPCL
jgi:hypothetical protein